MLPRVSVAVKDKKLVIVILVVLALIAAGYGAWSLYNAGLAEEVAEAEVAAESADGTPAVQAPASGTPNNLGTAASESADPASPFPVDLNTADTYTLQRLPNIGPVLADRIIAWRTDHGGFSNTDELLEIEGIGQATYEKLRELVVVGEE
jgi:competence protein ComEA